MPVLDGIRAIAVMTVIVAHAGLDRIVPGGFGVTIFFFLSGYLITSLMRLENLKTGTVSLAGFYARRLLRITPPLYITLCFSALVVAFGLFPTDGPFWNGGPVSPLAVLSQFLLFQNYAHFWGDPIDLPITGLWSLAVEEHYYLIFPLLYLLVLRRLTQRGQVAVCAAICAAALGFRLYHAATLPNFGTNYVWTHTRIDSILFGACLALANNPTQDEHAWRPRGWQAFAALGTIGLTLFVRDEWFRQTWRYTVQGGALYVLFGFALSNRGWVAAALASGPARMIARYSYTLYLVHTLLMGLALRWLPGLSWWPAMAVGILASFVYSMTIYAWVERPLAKLRRELHRERTGSSPHGALPPRAAEMEMG
jgi:peptidoglycan/LPS O-acetylase OafA/YrhL